MRQITENLKVRNCGYVMITDRIIQIFYEFMQKYIQYERMGPVKN